ncbi:hypothetical protein BV22DRAFT_1111448 [Leucogyrophana mollusca]|uniref:Uncharacterized protein n=1 Tax=Leucogyrophana mollusca TaxID=85980 RepID=A0ACB8BNU1_9AGAM|nr:hypothetical protein BV22DRAFT_1111448 [Leucogyrophana mollusca]
MLHQLPTEIALHTASYLPLYSLCKVTLVCRQWNELITTNESSVYRNAALLHRFVAPANVETELASQKPKLEGHEWRLFCRRRLEIERGWRGRGPSSFKELSATGRSVHRIKVDEEEGIVITTYQNGGLFVTDLIDNRVLWSLPVTHVVEYAHCEYDRGYIVFNRIDKCKEVWRRSRDFIASDVPEGYPPDEEMLRVSELAAERHASPTRRGHFQPLALLQMPEPTKAFRFAYPTLIAAAVNCAYLWDIPTSRLVQMIPDIQMANAPGRLGIINYVEVSDHYAFFCGSSQLRIFERETGTVVFHTTVSELPSTQWDVLPGQAAAIAGHMLVSHKLTQASHVRGPGRQDEFFAVHVSSSGKDMVALTRKGCLLIVRDFEHVVTKQVSLADAAVQLNFSPNSDMLNNFSGYLAFGDTNGKVAVATRTGIFIVSVEVEIDKLSAERPLRPGVSVCRVKGFDSARLLAFISCLQVSDRGVYFNWEPTRPRGRHPAVDLGPPPVNDPAALHGWTEQVVTQINAGGGQNHIVDEVVETDGNTPTSEAVSNEPGELHSAHDEAAGHAGDDEPPVLVEDVADTAETSSEHPTDAMDPASPDLFDLSLPELQSVSDSDGNSDHGMDESEEPSATLPPVLGPIDDDDEDEDMNAPPPFAFDGEAIHILLNDWFLPVNLSTVYSIQF